MKNSSKKRNQRVKKILYAIVFGVIGIAVLVIAASALFGNQEDAGAPVPTASPVATEMPTAEPTGTPTPAPTPVLTPIPTEVPTATPEITSTPTVEPTATPTPTPRVTRTPTPRVTPTPEPTVQVIEERAITVEAPNLTLQLTDATGKLSYDQMTEGDAHIVTFYMQHEDQSIPIYRLILGDAETGEWLGRLVDDTADVSVTYLVYTIRDEGMAETYGSLMEVFSKILNDVSNDPRFVPEKPLTVGADQGVSLAHWNLDLPSDITWEETAEADSYSAVFSGTIQGQSVPLYCVRIGDDTAQTVLGQYPLNDQLKPLSVETYDLPENAGWTEEDTSLAYHLMNTINDLIQAIMSSDGFVAAQ